MAMENQSFQTSSKPKESIRYWKLGTRAGERGPSQFDSMKEGNYISIGFHLGLDFSDIRDDEEGRKLLMDRIKMPIGNIN